MWGQANGFVTDDPKERWAHNRVFAVHLCDGRLGLLEVSQSHPFDGSDDWCALHIVGKDAGNTEDGRISYKAPEIIMPKDLRMSILRLALEREVAELVVNLDSYLIDEQPLFATYTEARCLLDSFDKKTERLPLDTLLEYISHPAPDEGCYCDESDIENLKRLMTEYENLQNAEQGSKGSPAPSASNR